MKTTKLVLGILGLIFSIIVIFQSCAASVVNSLEDNGDVGGPPRRPETRRNPHPPDDDLSRASAPDRRDSRRTVIM